MNINIDKEGTETHAMDMILQKIKGKDVKSNLLSMKLIEIFYTHVLNKIKILTRLKRANLSNPENWTLTNLLFLFCKYRKSNKI